jgi:osmoprotectant transport system ATP-binding protein
MISVQHVSKRFGNSKRAAVQDLSFDVVEGETVVLVGPSGCGKTTTMRMINRLIEPTSGQIHVDGQDVMRQDPVQLRRGIGYVIQSIGLMPHRTVAQNIATVPKLLDWDDARTNSRIDELMAIFDLDLELRNRYPGELSGGQRQRVGVARALAADPPVMLMDEPFAAVDPIVRARLQDQFIDIQERLRKTIVFVTHDIDEAIKLADRIAILNVGGVLEQFAPPEEILREPANEFVEDFVGAERGLKRLALIKVSEIEVEEGPVATPATAVPEVLREMQRFGLDWATVVDDGRLRGWVDARSLEGHQAVGEVEPRRFSAYVTENSSLREALDSIVTSRTQVAVVADEDDRYLGILTLERLSKEVIA